MATNTPSKRNASIDADNLTVSGSITAPSYNNSNWDISYTYSQIGHLPLSGGTLTDNLTISGIGKGITSYLGNFAYTDSDNGYSVNGTTVIDSSRNLVNINGYNKSNWDTAYSWGNHASAGYLPSSHDMTLTLTGDASGSATFTNMGNASLSVTVANDSHDHHRLLAMDDRDMKPNTSGVGSNVKGVRAFFSSLGGMTSTANTDYQDVLVLDTYSDLSGGNANAITMDKSDGSMRIWNAAQNSSSWGTSQRIFADNYHPNADKWTTARTNTVTLTGDVTGSGSASVDGSGNWTVSLNTAVGNDSHTHDTRYPQLQATFRSGAQNFDSLKTSGFHSLYNANASGHTNAPFQYGAMISAGNTAVGGGMAMQLAHERTGAGTYIRGMNDTGDTWYPWQRIFMDNYHPNADKWTTARTHTVTLTGDVTGSASQSVDGTGNKTWTINTAVVNDSHSHNHSDGGFQVNGKLKVTTGADIVSTSSNPFRWQRSSLSQTGQDDNVTVYVDDSNIYFTHNNDNDGDASGFRFRRMTGGSPQTIFDFDHGGIRFLGNNVYRDNYHPNADKWTTARTLSLTGDVTGSVSWDGSANASITTTVNDNSHNHHFIVSDSPSDEPSNALQYLNTNGTTTDSPTTDWYNIIRMGHGNPNTYYNSTLAMKMTGSNVGALYGRVRSNGTAGAWSRFFDDNYHPNADKWTTARTITLSGDLTGSVSIDGSSNVTLSAQVVNDSHTHDGRYVNVTGDTMTGDLILGTNQLNFKTSGNSTSPQILGHRSGTDLNSRFFTSEGGFSYTTFDGGTSNRPSTVTNNANGLFTFNTHSGSYSHQLAFTNGGGVFHRDNHNGTISSWDRIFADDYHPNADKWTTARTLSLTGDVTGSVSWDGSANASITTTVVNDSHNHDHSDGRFTVGEELRMSASGNIRSNSEFQFLTISGNAQTMQTGGIGVGASYGTYPAFTGGVNAQNGYQVAGTTVIDSSRSLININGLTSSEVLNVNRSGNGNAITTKTGSIINFQVENYTTQTTIRSDTGTLYFWQPNSSYQMKLVNNGAVSLAHDGSWKLDTTSGGVKVTGLTNSTTGFQINGTTVIDSGRNLTNIGHFQNDSMWVNDGSDYNGYNENIRLFNAPNGVSVIGFSCSGVSGTPITSILGYSNRLETRVGSTWRTRVYGGYLDVNGYVNSTGYRVGATEVIDSSRNITNINQIRDNSGSYFRSAMHSGSDFANGTLVTTSIPASSTNGASFVIEVTGKSYSSNPPFSFIAQGYLYNNTIISYSGVNNGDLRLTYIKAMNNNGYLSFWWPRVSYWNSFEVHVRDANGNGKNRVTSIANSTDPSGATKKVTINFHKSVCYDENTNIGNLHANNYKIGSTTVIDSSRNLTNVARVNASDGVIGGGNGIGDGKFAVRGGDLLLDRGKELRWNTGSGSGEYIYSKASSPYDVTIHSGAYDALQCPNTGQVRINYQGAQKFVTTSSGVSITGSLTATGNVTAYSDVTLKDNITEIDNALDKVNSIRGVTYDRIDQDNARHAGVIAQEVEEVLPEVVHTDDDGIKSVAYGNMVGLLIEAIKEQQAQINELKEELKNVNSN